RLAIFSTGHILRRSLPEFETHSVTASRRPLKEGAMKKPYVLSAALTAVLSGCAMTPPGPAAAKTEVCRATSEQEIADLFDRWNRSLQTGDPKKVVANYADRSILLPTVSNQPRRTAAEKEDYFVHFLKY